MLFQCKLFKFFWALHCFVILLLFEILWIFFFLFFNVYDFVFIKTFLVSHSSLLYPVCTRERTYEFAMNYHHIKEEIFFFSVREDFKNIEAYRWLLNFFHDIVCFYLKYIDWDWYMGYADDFKYWINIKCVI